MVRTIEDNKNPSANKPYNAFEMGYVCKFHSAFFISNIEKCFQYNHPVPEEQLKLGGNAHNDRFAKMNFTAEADSLCHGFAGYFH